LSKLLNQKEKHKACNLSDEALLSGPLLLVFA
jgi:hypothetical protein